MQRRGIRGVFGGVEQDVVIGAFADGDVATYRHATKTLEGAVPSGGGGAAPAVAQVVRTQSATPASTTAIIPIDNTIPQNTEGAAYSALDTTITPKAASSTLVIEVFIPLVSASTIVNLAVAIFRDSGADAVGVAVNSVEATNRARQFRAEVSVPAGSVAPTTFKVRYGGTVAATTYLLQTGVASAYFDGALKASMTVTEVSA